MAEIDSIDLSEFNLSPEDVARLRRVYDLKTQAVLDYYGIPRVIADHTVVLFTAGESDRAPLKMSLTRFLLAMRELAKEKNSVAQTLAATAL